MKNENMIEELNIMDIDAVNGAGLTGYRIGFAVGKAIGKSNGAGRLGGEIGSAIEDFFFS